MHLIPPAPVHEGNDDVRAGLACGTDVGDHLAFLAPGHTRVAEDPGTCSREVAARTDCVRRHGRQEKRNRRPLGRLLAPGVSNFKHHVRRFTGRSWGVSMRYRFRKLAQYLRGWMGYFGISEYYRPVPEIDEWLRRRVRM